jgi:alkaline phosphatase
MECLVPTDEAPHGVADVPLYAGGPRAHLFHGVQEQNVIFHVMVDALGLAR